MNPSFLINERIHLRAVEPEDLEVMYRIENDPGMWDVSSFIEPYSRHSLREYIASSRNDVFADRQLRLMIVWNETGEAIGTVDLDEFDPRHLRAGVGLAVLQSFRERGVAGEALQLLMDYVFRFLHFHQLYAYIPVRNTASLKLFEKVGFQRVALLKEWIRISGGYEDVTFWQYFPE